MTLIKSHQLSLDDMDTQYLAMVKARKILFNHDTTDPDYGIDLEKWRCEEMVDWTVNEPKEIGARFDYDAYHAQGQRGNDTSSSGGDRVGEDGLLIGGALGNQVHPLSSVGEVPGRSLLVAESAEGNFGTNISRQGESGNNDIRASTTISSAGDSRQAENL